MESKLEALFTEYFSDDSIFLCVCFGLEVDMIMSACYHIVRAYVSIEISWIMGMCVESIIILLGVRGCMYGVTCLFSTELQNREKNSIPVQK